MEKANPLIETEDDNSEPLTGGGALSGTVPSHERSGAFSRASTTQLSAGVAVAGSGAPRLSGTHQLSSSHLSGGHLSGSHLSGSHLSGSHLSGGHLSSSHPRAVRPVESGVFSGLSGPVTGEQLVDSLQSALSAASRGEAGLGSLHRSVKDASRALTSLRHAHESLGEELRVMYRGLNEVMSEKAAVERYAALLTQERDAALDAAEEARREAKRERDFLLREQDRFIQLLLEEHEAELQQLRRALSGRSSAPPPVSLQSIAAHAVVAHAVAPHPVIVQTEPTTGFRIGVEVKSGELEAAAEAETEATLRGTEVRAPELHAERRAVVPMPRPDLEETPVRSAPVARLQLAPSEPPPADPNEFEPGTERGIGERDSVHDRSLTEQHLFETLRSEAPAADGENRSRTYPPPPAVLDLDSLAAEVEGNSERPPPIRRIGAIEPKLHLKPAKVPMQLLDTLISRTEGDELDDKPQEQPQDKLQDQS